MTPFTALTSAAAPLLEDNLDTDVIFPARFLLLLDRAGLGRHAFHDRRHAADGTLTGEFVLDRPEFAGARLLLAGANFGSGSSREQAVWCLADFGIRCIVAVSFGDIFAANCVNNGVLPIALPRETVAALAAAGEPLHVDLEAQTIAAPALGTIAFAVKPDARAALLAGRDVTARILHDDRAAIETFEAAHRAAQPWLFQPTTGA